MIKTIKILQGLSNKYSELNSKERFDALQSAISLIQDYQKLKKRVSVEKIHKICIQKIMENLDTNTCHKGLVIAQAIVNYLGGQPDE